MHAIEPFYAWRDYYVAAEDKLSPFYKRRYSEFNFTHQIYNYFIHPQWDSIGSSTLFCKVIFVNYDKNFAVIEFIGEWNDTLHNDIMELKKELIDPMIENGIYKFVLIGENVLNFHGSDDSYYEAWQEDIADEEGYIIAINFHKHVVNEMRQHGIHHYVFMGEQYNEIDWRKIKPFYFHKMIEELLLKELGS